MRALGQQPDIQLLQQSAEAIGVVEAMSIFAPTYVQPIAKRILTARDHADKKTAIVITAQLTNLRALVGIHYPNLISVWQQSANFNARRDGVHPQ